MRSIFGLAICVFLMAQPVWAQPADHNPKKVTPLGHGLYMIEGVMWDLTAAIADEGILLVDTAYPESHDGLAAELTKLTDKKVRYIINTHFHRDHTGGNAAFGRDGAMVIGQEDLTPLLAAPYKNTRGQIAPGLSPEALPKITFPERMTLHLGGVTADIVFAPGAHTNSDSYVFFREANVLSAGDFFTSNRYPHLYDGQNATVDGCIAGLDSMIARADDNTKIVPGHGPLADKTILVQYRDMVSDLRTRVAALKTAGKSADDVVAENLTAQYDARWSFDSFRKPDPDAGPEFVRAIYRTLP